MKRKPLMIIGLVAMLFAVLLFTVGMHENGSSARRAKANPGILAEINVAYCDISGFIFAAAKDYQTAIAYFSEAITIDPKVSLSYTGRGYVYFEAKQYQNATNDFNEVIKLAPGEADAYNMRAWISAVEGKYKEALPDVNKALEINPEMAEAHDTLGYALFGLGKYKEALECYNRSIKISKKDGMVYYHRAQVYEKFGKKDLAERDYQKSSDLGYAPEKNN